ncbi:MAG: hypothetical protein ACREQ5_32895 [Candidatus Dormibacteria bacterium]
MAIHALPRAGWSISCNACGDCLSVDEVDDAGSWTQIHECAGGAPVTITAAAGEGEGPPDPVFLAFCWWCRDCLEYQVVDDRDRCRACSARADATSAAKEGALSCG